MVIAISSPNVAGHGGILTECGTLSVLQMLLDKGQFWLNVKMYQFSKCCWTGWNSDWMWKPISSLNVAGNDGILTERGNLSVLQMLLDMVEFLLNVETYQFSKCCWTRGQFLLNVETYQLSKCCWTRCNSDWMWKLIISEFSKCCWTRGNSYWTWENVSSWNVAG